MAALHVRPHPSSSRPPRPRSPHPTSDNAADYTIGPPIGFGASSTVYAAIHYPPHTPSSSSSPLSARGPGVPCALKVLDLDSLPQNALPLLRRETQLMSLSKHPNVLRVRGSWIDGHKLFIALRLMNAGSAADVMRYAWPGGMHEDVVRCILNQALQGLKCVSLLFSSLLPPRFSLLASPSSLLPPRFPRLSPC